MIDGGKSLKRCCDNPFCSSLPVDLRERLCADCVKASYAAGTLLPIDQRHPIVLVQGIILSKYDGKPNVMLAPGNFMLNPGFRPKSEVPFVLTEQEYARALDKTRYACFTDLVVGTFTNKAVRELMSDVRFVRALLDMQLSQSFALQNYQIALYHSTAYDAVHYVLRVARAYGVGPLTHAQIAELSGRNRTTVTKTMHEIALAEPELIEE